MPLSIWEQQFEYDREQEKARRKKLIHTIFRITVQRNYTSLYIIIPVDFAKLEKLEKGGFVKIKWFEGIGLTIMRHDSKQKTRDIIRKVIKRGSGLTVNLPLKLADQESIRAEDIVEVSDTKKYGIRVKKYQGFEERGLKK
jgi:hypothetical protein